MLKPTAASLAATLVLAGLASPAAAQDYDDDVLLAERFDVRAGGQLTVDVGDANVEIRTGGNEVVVEIMARGRSDEWAREVFERMNFEITRSGSEVRVHADAPQISSREWRRNQGAGVTAVIHTPAQFDVNVRTGDGNIRLDDIDGQVDLFSGDGNLILGSLMSEGLLSVETNDGNITADNLVASRIEIRTHDGNVTTGDLDADDTRIRTNDGNVTVAGSRGRIALSTGDGNVSVRMHDFAGAEFVSGDGNVVITAPRDLAAEVQLTAERIEVDGFAIDGRVERRRARGTIGGGGPSLEARTSDGRVRLLSPS